MFQLRNRISRTAAALREQRRARFLAVVGLIILADGILIGGVATASPAPWAATFSNGQGLVTNELDYSAPKRRGVTRSDQWLVTSGSLFAKHGAGWTGPIDGQTPDLLSRKHTGSAVFRAVTRRNDFLNVTVSFDLYVDAMTQTARTKKQAYDGVHVFLRYTNPQSLYAVSIDRRDNGAVVKIKRPGGTANGGTYTTLASAPHVMPRHTWVHQKVRVLNERRGVRITWWSGGREILNVLSNGTGVSAPLRGAGRVGLRGDNTEFQFRNFRVDPA